MTSELVCCDFCGRDTKNKSHVCRHCMAGARKHKKNEELSDNDIQALSDLYSLNGYERYSELARDVRNAIQEAIF